ncbi:uncharacterized protein LOC131323855 [Rhododendron vialii]|uniref:uncharacterized protein LOC131323855 n=1 Tax=Rhododendron vialii TaxID=182163 RepID=UPI00265DD86F|nr:uncharacterized protein LOC131323855 [Rhododendron vialii]
MTLRNKREVETRPEKAKPKEHLAPSDLDDFGEESSQSKEGTPPVTPTSPTSVSAGSKVPPYVPKAPFPSCLNAPSPFPKRGVSMEVTLEVFKQVKVNIPLLDAIKQVPTYAKFLKDLCTQKRKNQTNVSKKVLLTEQLSSVFQSDAPLKMQDPGTPTINIVIGRHARERALLDLGASVNLIPYLVYEQLGLGELKPTSITLQLADRSIKVPCGVVKDILVKVNDFYFSADFIVLDTEPMQTLKKQTPIFLGRPLLATADANIHVRSGKMEVTFGNMTLKLNVYKAVKHPQVEEDCFAVDVVEDLVEEALPYVLTNDPLAARLAHFGYEEYDIDQSIEGVNLLLNNSPPKWTAQFEPLPALSDETAPPFIEAPPKLELKPLPASHLFGLRFYQTASFKNLISVTFSVTVCRGDVLSPSHTLKAKKGIFWVLLPRTEFPLPFTRIQAKNIHSSSIAAVCNSLVSQRSLSLIS